MSKGNSTKPRLYAARVDWSQKESPSLVRLFVAASDNQARKHAVSGDISKRLRSEPGSFDGITCMIRRTSAPSPAQSLEYYVDAAEAARFLPIHPRPLQHQLCMTEWLTAAEAAAHLKVRPRTLLLWVRQGRVPAHRLSGVRRCVWRFLRSELDAMLTPSSAGAAQEEAC